MTHPDRRYNPFKFRHQGQESWFYLFSGTASFHQITPGGQHNVHGLSIKRLIAALRACGYIALFLLVPVFAEAKEVVIPYNDFLQMLAKGEHREKLLNQCLAQKEILLQVKDEQGKIIELKGEQIKGLIEAVEAHEQLGATEEKLHDVTYAAARAALKGERENRKWLAAGGFATGVVVTLIVMMMIN